MDKIKIIKNNYKDKNLFILFHVGYIDVAIEMINQMIECSINKKYTLCINFNFIANETIINLIEKNFDSYIITTTPNFGNDIAPSILVYEKFKNYFKDCIILKIHTKRDPIWRKELIELFF